MKKLALILAVLLALSLVACSDNTPDTPDTPEVTTVAPDTTATPDTTVVPKTEPPQGEDGKLFELFELNAGQIREKHGEITTEFYAYGGTPVCSLNDYAGVLCFFFDGSLDTPIADDLTPDWIALVEDYPYTFHGIETGKNIAELSTDLVWNTTEYNITGSHCLVAELDGYEVRVYLDIKGYDITVPDESTATQEDFIEWGNNFAKSPCGTITGVRINKIK